jgi:hypothetical protein
MYLPDVLPGEAKGSDGQLCFPHLRTAPYVYIHVNYSQAKSL